MNWAGDALVDGQTPLDPDEATGLRQAWIATRADLNLAEEANLRAARVWMQRAARRTEVLAQEFLMELHRRMFADVWDWAGRYRTTERNIGVPPARISSELRVLLDDARYWVEHDTYPVDESAVRLHHRLTAIHPFPNGNGRWSRFMADAFLFSRGESAFTWGDAGGLTRSDYLTAIRQADAHDYAALMAFVRG